MPAFKDLTGQTFGRLAVIQFVRRNKWKNPVWLCRCSCTGKEIEALSHNLRSGSTVNCGCFRRERAAKARYKHGHSSRKSGETPTYRSWMCMISRCTHTTSPGWSRYGGVGITVCERWRNSFEAFLEDMGKRPAGTTLGRFGDVGNYEPENCAWQDGREQRTEQRIKRQLKLLAVAA